MNLASLEVRLGHAGAAREHAERAVAQAREGMLRDFETTYQLLLGEAALIEGQLDGALEAFERARTLAGEMKLEAARCEADVGLARTILAWGRPGKALETARAALETADRACSAEPAIRAGVAAGEAEIVLENFSRAAYYFRKALEQVLETMTDLAPPDREPFAAQHRRIFERAQWLTRKTQEGNRLF
jgi:tetratricopeptide (TPR) repeat protein